MYAGAISYKLRQGDPIRRDLVAAVALDLLCNVGGEQAAPQGSNLKVPNMVLASRLKRRKILELGLEAKLDSLWTPANGRMDGWMDGWMCYRSGAAHTCTHLQLTTIREWI